MSSRYMVIPIDNSEYGYRVYPKGIDIGDHVYFNGNRVPIVGIKQRETFPVLYVLT